MLSFGNLLNSVTDIVSWIENTIDRFNSIWQGIDFTLLYSWLPQDISVVITAAIAVLLFLAVCVVYPLLLSSWCIAKRKTE